MLYYVLIGVAAGVAVLVVVVAVQASSFRVVRSATIEAPPDVVFAQVNDLRNWAAWSPWAKLDPACAYTYDGPAAGEGAAMSWAGNSKVGAGRMTILQSRPHGLIRIKLEFLRPFRATNTAEFAFVPERGRTAVTWSMFGAKNFMSKAFGLIMDMDKISAGTSRRGWHN